MGMIPGTQALEQVIGIDLGGTAIKLGRFNRDGHCFHALSVPTPQPPQLEVVLAAMVEAIAQVDPHNQCQAIGLGTPGPADAAGRIARVAINLGWQDVPLADWLEEKTGKPTVLANDANCAGLGEYWLGAGRSFRDVILLTLGTGVGGAVILDGKLFVGREGTAGELGLITLDFAGPACNSGNQGSLEQHVSVQAIRRRTGLEPDELGHRAMAGDPEAIAFWKTYGCELGAGLASLVYVLTPEAIIIGGGVSASAKFFFPAMQEELERRVLASSRSELQLLPAQLGNQAGMVGAAKLAWQLLDAAPPQSEPASQPQSNAHVVQLATQLRHTQLAYHMASELTHFKSGFLARTSHELRSPLNSIISLHQLILSGLCDNLAEEQEFVAQAHATAQKMLGLLDELIQVSKLEHGTAQLQIQPLQLNTLFRDVYRLTHMQAQNRSLRLTIEFPDPDLYILADPRWMHQILLRLIDAPIALMDEGTIRMTSHLSPETGQVHILVEDERPASAWSEPMDLLQSVHGIPSVTPTTQQDAIALLNTIQLCAGKSSPGMSLLVNQAILQLMQGQLEILSTPLVNGSGALSANSSAIRPTPLTRIQCIIPMVTLEDH